MTAPQVPDRVRWAVEVLDPAPATRVLEIGCGPGAAAEVIVPRLATGTMLAIDRSPVAVDRARRRNSAHLHDGRLDVRRAALAELDAPPGAFDLAFAINVNVFWTTDAQPELSVLRGTLDAQGRLAILYGPRPDDLHGATRPSHLDRVQTTLERQGFTVDEILLTSRGSGVVARPPS